MAIPEGPAQAWLLADLDTGRILASRNPYEPHAPASTIKALLAMVVLDQLQLNTVIAATPANTDVECSCVGVKAGQAYTVRQLLDGLMLVSGNDAANTLADRLGGYQAAVARMNAKAAALGARNTQRLLAVGSGRAGMESITTPYDLAVIYRAALRYPAVRRHRAPAVVAVPHRRRTQEDRQPERAAAALSRHAGRQDRLHQPRAQHLRRRRAAQRPTLVVVQMYGSGDLYGQAIGLLDWGFSQYG